MAPKIVTPINPPKILSIKKIAEAMPDFCSGTDFMVKDKNDGVTKLYPIPSTINIISKCVRLVVASIHAKAR